MAMRLYDITTGTGDFIANGVVSHNCFARRTHTYLDLDAGHDFETGDRGEGERGGGVAARVSAAFGGHEHVAMGTNMDSYQRAEGRYKLMRGIWEALRDAANPCSVLTKSPLLLRDLDLMKQIAEVTDISANLSVPMIDEKACGASELDTPNPRARLEAVGELTGRGSRPAFSLHRSCPASTTTPRRWRRSWRRWPTPGRPGSAASGCTSGARCGALRWSGCGPTGPTSSSATRSSMHGARTCRA